MLDIFNDSAFSLVSLTDAIREIPHVPARVGQMGIFTSSSVNSTSIALENVGGTIQLVPPTPRGGPGSTRGNDKRSVRSVAVPHFQIDDAVMAEEVQGLRAFGSETVLMQVQDKVLEKIDRARTDLEATIEYHRVGAVKGVVTYADGTTLDLFSLFGVSQETEVDFDLDNATPAAGALREKCDDVDRLVANNLGAVTYSGLHALCGTAFWKNLIAHPEVREIYLASQTAAMRLLDPTAYRGTLKIGNITFEEYRGKVGSTDYVHTDKVHIFPVGVPNLFRTYWAPADYMETVNTPGREWYAKLFPMPNDKGMSMEVQTNQLCLCTRPKALIKGRRT